LFRLWDWRGCQSRSRRINLGRPKALRLVGTGHPMDADERLFIPNHFCQPQSWARAKLPRRASGLVRIARMGSIKPVLRGDFSNRSESRRPGNNQTVSSRFAVVFWQSALPLASTIQPPQTFFDMFKNGTRLLLLGSANTTAIFLYNGVE